ncbi:FixH family protein [Blastochloris sulfoviridis]|uniref:FixH family protein n=1 Tax=Blastochloris sulfoviridis TaxID=50712 RepID=A0A5M6I4H8_9HYPH|nr:FixH family protein [Blastochloris sulfoviridis]KAA5603093.1 FixH family protein [Blastochloris sulfoviridis]
MSFPPKSAPTKSALAASPRHASGPGTGRPLTGRAVLIWLLGFFAVVICVNAAMAWLAISSFSGTVVDSAYRAGQEFNHEIEAARAQAARHWAVSVDVARTAEGGAEVRLTARDGDGQPVAGHSAHVELQRPADRRGDVALELNAKGAGVFASRVAALEAGQWDVVITISGREGPVFRSRNRVMVP